MPRTRARKPKAEPAQDSSELAKVLGEIETEHGAGSVRTARQILQPDRVSTGSFLLDLCLLGGIPESRASLLAGKPHAGKTMMSCKMIADYQRRHPDKMAVWVDVEGTFDTVWAEKLGVDVDRLQITLPQTGEQATDQVQSVLEAREAGIIIVDSMAAMAPTKEVESSAADAHMGLQARMFSTFTRRVTSTLAAQRKREHRPVLLLLNQFRTNIGQLFGDKRVLPGGSATRHLTSVEIYIRNTETVAKGEDDFDVVTHNVHNFDVKKNKCNAGSRTGEFKMCRMPFPEYGLKEGDIDDAKTMLNYAKKFGFWSGGGTSWKLDIWETQYKFGKADEAVKWLYEDRARYWSFRNFLIHRQADKMGMPKAFLKKFYDDSEYQ